MTKHDPFQAQILVLTDRTDGQMDLLRSLGSAGTCTIAGLQTPLPFKRQLSLIVVDVYLDDLTTINLVNSALTVVRDAAIPVLFLLRNSSHLTEASARLLGATAIFPRYAPRHELIALVGSLISFDLSGRSQEDSKQLQADVRQASHSLVSMFEAARHQQAISSEILSNGGSAVLAAVRRTRVNAWLDIVRRYDDATYQHCLLVAGLAAAFASHLGLAHKHQFIVAKAALVHDIGKARIPLAILNKPGKLTQPEMTIMKSHAPIGHGMLLRQGGFSQQILDIVRHHHEFLDGSGYPDGLRGEQISQFVRLITICDIYAALIERRPYKAPMLSNKAISILGDMQGKIDTALLQTFRGTIHLG